MSDKVPRGTTQAELVVPISFVLSVMGPKIEAVNKALDDLWRLDFIDGPQSQLWRTAMNEARELRARLDALEKIAAWGNQHAGN